MRSIYLMALAAGDRTLSWKCSENFAYLTSLCWSNSDEVLEGNALAKTFRITDKKLFYFPCFFFFCFVEKDIGVRRKFM